MLDLPRAGNRVPLLLVALALALVAGLAPLAHAEIHTGGGATHRTRPFAALDDAYRPHLDHGSLSTVARLIGVRSHRAFPTGQGVGVALLDTGVVPLPALDRGQLRFGADVSFEASHPAFRSLDTNGHGTHLAGIIAARDAAWVAGNTRRHAHRFLGIAPDATLVSVKAAVADGGTDVTQLIAGINWIIANAEREGIRVLNLAFGTDGDAVAATDPLIHAVERAWAAGIVVVVSAGNDGSEAERLTVPAISPHVIAVGASEVRAGRDQQPTGFTNGSGERGIDVMAPGRSIVSLRVPGSFSDGYNTEGRVAGQFVRGSGTSQAAAVVSGAVALLLEAHPELTPDQVKHLLVETAQTDRGPNSVRGGPGHLRVNRALRAAASVAPVTSTAPWSDGTGSLDDTRGSAILRRDGVALVGQQDVFGEDRSPVQWREDAWTGRSWDPTTGWTPSPWAGLDWAGRAWTAQEWSAHRWSAHRWSTEAWEGGTWSGEAWAGHRWSSHRWNGAGWFDLPPSEAVG